MKKRVAIFLVGGVGFGISLQGVPAITAIIRALTNVYAISVYSLASPDPSFRPSGYSVVSPPRWLAGTGIRKVRWSYLATQFLAQHRRQPYDVVFAFWGYPMGLFAVALAKLVRKPSVVAILGAETAIVPSIGYGYLGRPIPRRLVLATCSQASAVVVLSSQQREVLRQFGSRASIEVIPFGVDPEMFTPRAEPSFSTLKILNVGNLTAVKDQATLIHGFALLRQELSATLRIVGPDHMQGRLQRLAADLGLHRDVEFVGPISYAAMPAQYQWADVFVLTSLYEGQSLAIVEAAMSGVLVVSTPVGCIPDLGEDAAVVVRAGDPRDLAAKIRNIASDSVRWHKKVTLARTWALRHDFRWTVGRLTEVIERAGSRK